LAKRAVINPKTERLGCPKTSSQGKESYGINWYGREPHNGMPGSEGGNKKSIDPSSSLVTLQKFPEIGGGVKAGVKGLNKSFTSRKKGKPGENGGVGLKGGGEKGC